MAKKKKMDKKLKNIKKGEEKNLSLQYQLHI